MHLIFVYEVQKMNEKKIKNKYEKRFQFQQKMISRQSEQIDALKSKIEKLENELIEKDKLISSVEPMRKEMAENINEQKKLKEEYRKLIQELKMMKNIVNEEVFQKRWWLIKFFLK